MEAYEIHARHFLEVTHSRLSKCRKLREFESVAELYTRFTGDEVTTAHGLTRVAFLGSDFVVKIDLSTDYIDQFGGCENECTMYKLAQEEGYEYLLARITRVEYGNHRFYIMPRVMHIFEEEPEDVDFWAQFTEDEYDWVMTHLFDIHDGNVGYNTVGHPIIIDYAAVFIETSNCGEYPF